MGIKGLFPFLKRCEQDVDLKDLLANQSAGLDIFWWIHRSKGDITQLKESLEPILHSAAKIHAVFDGAPCEERKQLLQAKWNQEDEQWRTIHALEEHLQEHPCDILQRHAAQLRRQVWKPSPEYIQSVKEWLSDRGATIHIAEDEADLLLVQLEQKGVIAHIIGNDSDLLILGAQSLLRPYGDRAKWLYRSHLMQELNCTESQWEDFMYLCGHMKDPDVLLAYSLIRVYKELDYGLQRYEAVHHRMLVE
jgi:hypothetical protein